MLRKLQKRKWGFSLTVCRKNQDDRYHKYGRYASGYGFAVNTRQSQAKASTPIYFFYSFWKF